MTQAELFQALKTIGIPVTYRAFKEPVEPPYLIYAYTYNNDQVADNHNYVDISNFQIELYNTRKDLATERLVQDKLKELKLPYSKVENYLASEGMVQVVYEIQLIGG